MVNRQTISTRSPFYRKWFISVIMFGILVLGVALFPPNLSFATTTKSQPIKVTGLAHFVLKGTVVAISADTITLHITNTTKNAKLFDGKDKTISVGSKVTITKEGKKFSAKQIKVGNKVKVFGIFDKKTGSITMTRWIKVLSK